jgi:hypothetical protein
MGYRKRAFFDKYPGRGPFSHLPPSQRPGHAFHGRGRGWGGNPQVCARFPWLPRRWWADPQYAYHPPTVTSTPQDEIVALEDSKNALGEEKDSIEQEINDVETQLKQLKSKLAAEKNQQPTGQ